MKKKYSVLEIDALIRQKESSISYTKQVCTSQNYYETGVKRLEDIIAKLTKQLDELTAMREDGPAIIEQYEAEIQNLIKERILAKHRKKVERLLKAQNRINNLT